MIWYPQLSPRDTQNCLQANIIDHYGTDPHGAWETMGKKSVWREVSNLYNRWMGKKLMSKIHFWWKNLGIISPVFCSSPTSSVSTNNNNSVERQSHAFPIQFKHIQLSSFERRRTTKRNYIYPQESVIHRWRQILIISNTQKLIQNNWKKIKVDWI